MHITAAIPACFTLLWSAIITQSWYDARSFLWKGNRKALKIKCRKIIPKFVSSQVSIFFSDDVQSFTIYCLLCLLGAFSFCLAYNFSKTDLQNGHGKNVNTFAKLQRARLNELSNNFLSIIVNNYITFYGSINKEFFNFLRIFLRIFK